MKPEPAPAPSGEVVLYQAADGTISLDVRLARDTVWLSQQQMAELFGRERSVITKHVRNVFREGELDPDSVCAKFAHTAADGKSYQVDGFNLDVVISVGYRVKSAQGTRFRQWATRVLREHLVKGYTANAKRLRELNQAVRLIADTARRREISGDEAKALLAVVADYHQAFGLLDDYDHQRVGKPASAGEVRHPLGYDEALRIVGHLRERFGPSDLFGVEKDKGMAAALGAVMQTFGGQDLYPGLEEKAAHLLYFLVKNHAFVDGNKRIAAALFLWFLDRNGALARTDGTPRISNATLVAVTLMIAESRAEEREILVRIVMHLLGEEGRDMTTTDTSERGLERLICTALTGAPCDPGTAATVTARERPATYPVGWVCGAPEAYDREYCVDLAQLSAFLQQTQPEVAEALALGEDGPTRRKFLARLQGEVTKRGTIDVLRHGIKHGALHIDLFYGTPTPGNAKAEALNRANRFGVTRQLRYSRDETQRALDLGLFINGLPVATFELKNSLTKQTVEDAVEQYKRDRDPREKLFEFGRCAAHFAVDEHEVRFCTHLKGKGSWFLPFNQGWDDGAGNPLNPNGLKTDYLWNRILTRAGLTDILENYAQIVEVKDEKTGKKKATQVWPRFHQLDVVRRLLADARQHGAGRRYLVQHSAGSGKSNSIAWLSHQLIGLAREGKPVFDSIVVVTDRRILDQQIRDTIRQFAQVSATVGHAEHSGDLRKFIAAGKKIIITTVQKFPFVLDEIGSEHRGRRFAVVIDEAHSSQGGRTSAALSMALSAAGAEEDDETLEDKINRLMEAKKLLPNASYFAFTATPKNKTLEIFGRPDPQPDGTVKHRPFHSYTMKQATQEGFILDVLKHYTPVASYYKLVKKMEADPEFDTKRAKKKLRRYVESHDHAIRLKAEIMVDHFHEQVLALNKIGGEARAMVVTSGIERAIQYFHAVRDYLAERKSRCKAIVAFSGEHEYGGAKVTEASLNGFPSSRIADRIEEDPYRFLICADKFQTGYDEPLLHTMYVDKALSGIKAVQTLSRLNRAHPKKHDVFVLDFMNDADTIQQAFADYYRTTILAEETDPNKLHDLKATLDGAQVYEPAQIDAFVELYLGGAERDKLDPILDACVAAYREQLDEDAQVDFKGKAKAFIRTYGFLSSVLPYTNAEWEKLSIFLNFLVSKLPAPVEEDLSKGILEAIDMDSYRVEKQAVAKIQLPDADAQIDPVPTAGGGRKPEAELDRLSNILTTFNDQFGNIPWTDADRVNKLITEDIPSRVAADKAYQNARQNSDKQNARIEHDKALTRVMTAVLKDDTELFRQFMDNESFRRWLTDTVFSLTYEQPHAGH